MIAIIIRNSGIHGIHGILVEFLSDEINLLKCRGLRPARSNKKEPGEQEKILDIMPNNHQVAIWASENIASIFSGGTSF
jgi:hypothetical protein